MPCASPVLPMCWWQSNRSNAFCGTCYSSRSGPHYGGPYARVMCRNITELRGLEPPATRQEIEAAALQFVRKITGIAKPNPVVAEQMNAAALEIAAISE